MTGPFGSESHDLKRQGRSVLGALKRDDFSSNRPHVLAYCLSMIFSENRYLLFEIMLSPVRLARGVEDE
jgi:hypothetical protein